MTDVFISYASEDRERVRTLASTLEACGWSVWWDRHIVVGQSFDQAIEHEIETAKCVVVLWSKDSITSEWVKNEAAVAAERGVLVPALIDNVKIPLEFRRKQTADLVTWEGTFDHAGFQALRDGIANKTNKTGMAPSQADSPPLRGSRGRRGLAFGAIAAVAVAGLVVVLFHAGVLSGPDNQGPSVDTKEVAAASSPPDMPELESRLKAVNIRLSTGTDKDTARVRGYFTGPDAPYYLLAVSCLQVLGDRRLRVSGYLDMIDKWYTLLVGEGHYAAGDEGLEHEKLKEAIVKANNDYHSQNATSFEQLVESRR